MYAATHTGNLQAFSIAYYGTKASKAFHAMPDVAEPHLGKLSSRRPSYAMGSTVGSRLKQGVHYDALDHVQAAQHHAAMGNAAQAVNHLNHASKLHYMSPNEHKNMALYHGKMANLPGIKADKMNGHIEAAANHSLAHAVKTGNAKFYHATVGAEGAKFSQEHITHLHAQHKANGNHIGFGMHAG